jgi:hypothetical protein
MAYYGLSYNPDEPAELERVPREAQTYGIKFRVPRGSNGQDWPTKVAERIFTRYLLDWIGLFLQKNASYGEGAYHVDGLAGYWPELRRKVARLRRAIWQGEDTSDWTEQPAEIIFDLIGTLLMCYDLLSEQVGPKVVKGEYVADDFLSSGEQTMRAANELLDKLTQATPARKAPDGMTSLGKGEVFVGPPADTAIQRDTQPDYPLSALWPSGEPLAVFTFDGPLPGGLLKMFGDSLDVTSQQVPDEIDSEEPGDGGWCALPDQVKAVLMDINARTLKGQPVSKEQAIVLADYYSNHGERL